MGNARQSSIEIGEKTGLSRQTVQKTIRKLERVCDLGLSSHS